MHRMLLMVLSIAIYSLTGCGSSGGEVEATGVVLMDGNPLDGALVRFIPAEGTKGAGGAGNTDSSGKFTISSPQGLKKILPGKYKVVVSKTNVRQPKEGEKMVLIDSDIKELLPPIYSNQDRTILSYTVESPTKPIEIKLEGKPAKK